MLIDLARKYEYLSSENENGMYQVGSFVRNNMLHAEWHLIDGDISLIMELMCGIFI